MNDPIEHIAHDIEALRVPLFDFAAVRNKAVTIPRRPRATYALSITGLFIALPALAAAAALHFFHPQIYQRGNNMHVYSDHLTTSSRPSSATLSRIAQQLDYPIVLPSGLPRYAKLRMTAVADSEVVYIAYTCPGKRFIKFFIGPKHLTSLLQPAPDRHHVKMNVRTTQPWRSFVVGDEIVRMATNCLTRSDVARLKAAMNTAGAAANKP